MWAHRQDELVAAARLLRRGLAFTLGVVVAIVVLALLDETHDDYPAVVREKHARIASLPSPKIVITGGSNAAFGIATDLIQADSHLPAVNMAIWADVGLPFMLAEVAPYLHRGDILVVTPEYELAYKATLGDRARYRVVAFLPRPWNYMKSPFDGLRFVLSITVERAQATFQKWIRRVFGRDVEEPVYSRRAFNEFGDVIAHVHDKPKLDTTAWTRIPADSVPLDVSIFTAVAEFGRRFNARGVRTLIIPPAILDLQYRRDRENVERVHAGYTHAARDGSLLMLGTPSDFVFPASLMYDTHYHLNGAGRTVRTRRMIELMKVAGVIR